MGTSEWACEHTRWRLSWQVSCGFWAFPLDESLSHAVLFSFRFPSQLGLMPGAGDAWLTAATSVYANVWRVLLSLCLLISS